MLKKKFLTNNAFSNERTHTLQICIKNDATVNKISEPCQAHNETKKTSFKKCCLKDTQKRLVS